MTDDVDPTEPMPLDPEPLLGDDTVLAPFVEALRGPATAGELAAEAAVVDLMVVAITPPTTLKDRRIMKSRFARTAAIAAAVVLSAGGVAAAATGANPLGPIVHFADHGPNLETAPGEKDHGGNGSALEDVDTIDRFFNASGGAPERRYPYSI